ncbi:hypothetical protein [Chamaesiphon sp. VAR_48_metabat_403]|uniref:hypothetical protein n=1 Tax=Chamaesiphon sp. VAR_48_metabat_403 TaxID=2964700 RepID=UPI00286E4C16|nr:hypothetical protein [Chamaesiphon sp. VAR_48_metabat_403]
MQSKLDTISICFAIIKLHVPNDNLDRRSIESDRNLFWRQVVSVKRLTVTIDAPDRFR